MVDVVGFCIGLLFIIVVFGAIPAIYDIIYHNMQSDKNRQSDKRKRSKA